MINTRQNQKIKSLSSSIFLLRFREMLYWWKLQALQISLIWLFIKQKWQIIHGVVAKNPLFCDIFQMLIHFAISPDQFDSLWIIPKVYPKDQLFKQLCLSNNASMDVLQGRIDSSDIKLKVVKNNQYIDF